MFPRVIPGRLGEGSFFLQGKLSESKEKKYENWPLLPGKAVKTVVEYTCKQNT